jgi:hypothetical protein
VQAAYLQGPPSWMQCWQVRGRLNVRGCGCACVCVWVACVRVCVHVGAGVRAWARRWVGVHVCVRVGWGIVCGSCLWLTCAWFSSSTYNATTVLGREEAVDQNDVVDSLVDFVVDYMVDAVMYFVVDFVVDSLVASMVDPLRLPLCVVHPHPRPLPAR